MNIKNGAYAPTGSACLEKVLSRLDKVKQGRADRWTACCPAHDDKTPSLAITEAGDGTVLLRCWAGCTAAEIVTAIGLELRDLFPGNDQRPQRRGPSRKAIEHERQIIRVAQAQLAQGKALKPSDQQRLELAQQRLRYAQ